MHKIYEENGKYNLKYQLPHIILSDIISIITSYLFEELIDYQEDLIDLKINLDNNEKEEQVKKIKKSFRRNRIIFYLISFLIQIFSWYFISCFFAVYVNTQIYLLIDFLIGLSLSLGNLVIRSFFYFIFKLIATKPVSNYDKCFAFIFKIINYKLFNIIFEYGIEIISLKILKK